MDKAREIYFKNKLLQEKKDTMKTLKMMENHHPTEASMREYTEELSAYDNHPADLGSEMYIASMQANLENHERYRITEIDKAIESIESGTYGECQLCGSNIPEERLEIMPESNICIKCAEDKLEVFKSTNEDRPVEEELMSPSYRTSNRNYNDYTGFDEEDAYQAVAKFNEIKNDPSFATGDNLGVFDDYDIGNTEKIEDISEEYYRSQLPYTGHGIMDSEDYINKDI